MCITGRNITIVYSGWIMYAGFATKHRLEIILRDFAGINRRTQKMTNAEKIRNMSTEELADFIYELITICDEADTCGECKYFTSNICVSAWQATKWLESEAEE